MSRRRPGRPGVVDGETLKKLDDAFLLGCTDREACFLAGISTTTLYNYQNKHPEYQERKAALKDSPAIKARREVLEAIESGDTQTARWYLERRRPEEFKEGKDINITGDQVLTIQDRQEAIADFLERFK